jgi:hypothetical protein
VEELNAGCNVLDAAELDVEQAEAELATANWKWDTYVPMVNQLDGFMVKVTKSAGAAFCIVCAQYCHCVGASAVRRYFCMCFILCAQAGTAIVTPSCSSYHKTHDFLFVVQDKLSVLGCECMCRFLW